ncbi:MAG: hypothetical protein JW955_02495 [Sedimentisphaerales bacterium]|nr:hypothetical protein [Sedimentisphaerales bacterium]
MRAHGWLLGMIVAAVIIVVPVLWLRGPTTTMLSSELPKARVTSESMGNPQRILISAKTCAGDIPLEWAAWRILDVRTATTAEP